MFYVVTDSEKNDSQETFVELSKILSVKKKHTKKSRETTPQSSFVKDFTHRCQTYVPNSPQKRFQN